MSKINNRLIAEFMRLPKVPCNIGTEDGHFNEGYKHPKVAVPIIPSGMQYKYSWDWLMPVVEKIEEYGYDFIASKRRATLTYDANFMDEVNNDVVYVEDCKDRKEATYKAVVEFIKYLKL